MTNTSIYNCITENVIANFKPTRLYIKRHSVTGLMYFGKTVKTDKDFEKYNGSGSYWSNHIKKYGVKHVKTIWVSDVYTIDRIRELVRDALDYSTYYDIVISEEWANQIIENGLGGWPPQCNLGRKHAPERNAEQSERMTGKPRGSYKESFPGLRAMLAEATSIRLTGVIRGPNKKREAVGSRLARKLLKNSK